MSGHSTGGGEVARYIGRHGTARVAKAVLIGAVPPLMLKTPANPGGLPMEVFDGIRAGVLADRSQFFKDLTEPFYGANRPGREGVAGRAATRSGCRGCRPATRARSTASRRSRRRTSPRISKKFDVPTLILHGDDDQIVPIGASAMLSSKLVKGATLKVYPGLSHGMCTINKDQVNTDLLAFIKA